MNYFHAGYHLLAMILQYAWGLIAALGVYVVLPLVAAAFVFSVLNSISLRGKVKNDDEQF